MNRPSLNKLTPAFFFQRFLEKDDPDHVTQFVQVMHGLQIAAVVEPYFLGKLVQEIKQHCGFTPTALDVSFSFFTPRDNVSFYNSGGFNITIATNRVSTMLTFCPGVEGYYHSYGLDVFSINAYDMTIDDRNILRWELARHIAHYMRDVCDCVS